MKQYKLFLAFIGIFALSGCDRGGERVSPITAPPAETVAAAESSEAKLERQATAAARELVLSQLKAPDSATFDPKMNSVLIRGEYVQAAGEVYALNGFGVPMRQPFSVQARIGLWDVITPVSVFIDGETHIIDEAGHRAAIAALTAK